MKKNISLTIFAVLIAMGFASLAVAETTSTSPMIATTGTAIPTPAVQTTEGTVSALDVQSATPWIKVKQTGGQEVTIQIEKTSTAWKIGKQVAWADIKINDKVKARYTAKEGKETAKTVEIEA